jgi:hypothetical protein
LRLAYWNADGIQGKKQELEHFLGQHGIDICMLTATHLRSGLVLRMANYVCHRNDRLTVGGGTEILVRRGIHNHAVPIQGLEYREATAILVKMVSIPARILAVYLSPPPLLDADLTACLGGGLSFLMAGDLNSKHLEWNSRLFTRRRLLRDYPDKNFCLVNGPNSPTTVPYNSIAIPDVLDIVNTKHFSTPVYLTSCSALNSYHLPILIDTECRSFCLNLPDRHDLRKTY